MTSHKVNYDKGVLFGINLFRNDVKDVQIEDSAAFMGFRDEPYVSGIHGDGGQGSDDHAVPGLVA